MVINTNATVGTSPTTIAVADSSVTYKIIMVTNDSPNVIYLSINEPASMNKGIRLNQNWGSVSIDMSNVIGLKWAYISAISATGGGNVCISIIQ